MSALARLPMLVQHIAALPPPDQVLRALRLGVFAPMGMRAGVIWRLDGPVQLVRMAACGHTQSEEARFATFPVGVEPSLGAAIREDRVDVQAAPDFEGLSLAGLDSHPWHDVVRRHHASAVVTFPLRFDGSPVGAVRMVLAQRWVGGMDQFALVNAVADLGGVWLTHPAVGCALMRSPASVREWSLSFTERQREVLRLVEEGVLTHDISMRLQVSESTVRQDLRWAMRALRASSRRVAVTRARALGLL